MKKIVIFIGVVLLLLITSFYIFRDNKKDVNRVIVSEVTHSVFYAPWYVAIENGYFKDEGIDIELILTPGADKVGISVLSGDANIGLSGPEATMYIYNNSKEKLISFASLTKRDGQFIVGDCSLKDNFDMSMLIGKSVLAGRSAGMPLMMFEYALKESGIDKNKIKIDSSIDFASLSSAYISGQGDFVNLFEPNATALEQNGYGCVLSSLGSISGSVPYTTFYAKEEYLKNNKQLINKFNKALNKGLRFVHQNDSMKIAEVIANSFTDMNIENLTMMIDRYKSNDSWYDSTILDLNDFNHLEDIMIYGKAIDIKIDPKILLTNEFNK